MKADEFFEKDRNGEYGIIEKPRRFDKDEVLCEIKSNTPEIINRNRSVNWNERKREEIIYEEYQKRYADYSDKKTKWHNMEKDSIVRYHNDKISMLKEELKLNKAQVIYLFEILLNHPIMYCEISEREFHEIKSYVTEMRKLFELADKE